MSSENMKTKKKPAFTRQDSHKKKRLGKSWRKPKGLQSKMRLNKRGKKPSVRTGYKSPHANKHLTKEGKLPVLIHTVSDLSKVDKNSIGVIAANVGKKKTLSILEAAKKDNVTLLTKENRAETIKTSLEERKSKREALNKKRSQQAASEKKEEKKESKAEEKNDEAKEKERLEQEKELIKKGAQE